MKEELCEKVVEVRRVGDRVMTVVVFEVYVLRLNLCLCFAKWEEFGRKTVCLR